MQDKNDHSLPAVLRSMALYRGFADLTRVHVSESGNRAKVSREGESVVIVGSKENLAILAQNVISVADPTVTKGPKGHKHAHIGFFPGHYDLREESEPLLVSLEE